jgi:hypothetical protein
MKFQTVRRHALAMEAVTEAPHHDFGSFRVRGKIFATVPPGETLLHVFVGEEDRERTLALHPGCTEKLLWGRKAVGLRIDLGLAPAPLVKQLLDQAYATRVAKDAGPKPARKAATR